MKLCFLLGIATMNFVSFPKNEQTHQQIHNAKITQEYTKPGKLQMLDSGNLGEQMVLPLPGDFCMVSAS